MKLNSKQLTQSLKALLMLSPMVVMALPLGAIAAPRPGLEFCGEGTVPTPQELNDALGPCMPGSLQTPTQPEFTPVQLDLPLAIAKPDLVVKKYIFTGSKTMRVFIANQGNGNAAKSVYQLSIRKINGIQVKREMSMKTPAIASGQGVWLSVNADSLLPNNITLKSTKFLQIADVGKQVMESNERNNVRVHP